jgi:succinate dehydrogenase / fumarate reductase flavoprotein subunit
MLTVSEAVARAARERKESRGAHSRVDFPDKDPEWGDVNLVLGKGSTGEMEVRREAIRPMPRELEDIIREQG